MSGNRINNYVLCAITFLIIVSAWFPFTVDPPYRARNTAERLVDGTWVLSKDSRVTASAPNTAASMIAGRRFRLNVIAQPVSYELLGPARLFSIGTDPYSPEFMIGIEREVLVIHMPCLGSTKTTTAIWEIPLFMRSDIAVTLWFEGTMKLPLVEVQGRPPTRLNNNCPAGSTHDIPEASVPWTIGNVYSSHRPFIGHISKLELSDGVEHIDLLRDVQWHLPDTYWVLPERLYERTTYSGTELVAAIWHFISFVLLSYSAAATRSRHDVTQLFVATFVFAIFLASGKIFITGRHPDLLDIFLHAAGALVGIYGYKRYAAGNRSPSPVG